MSYPIILSVPGMSRFAEEVDTERQAQLKKWGDQHHPDIHPNEIRSVTAQPDGQEPDCTCDSDDNTHDGGCATAARWAREDAAEGAQL